MKESWEIFLDFFGQYYSLFLVFVGHSTFFFVCLNAAWPSPVLPKLSDTKDNPLGYPITPDESDLIGSLFFVGASIGPLLTIGIVERFGRRKILTFMSLIVPIAYTLLAFGENVELYYVCRVFLGLYSGAALSMEPVYISEVLPPKQREFLMSFVTFFGFSGILITYSVVPFVPLSYFNASIAVISSIFIVLLSFGCPKSPYFLIKTEGSDSTRYLLKKLRNSNDVDGELEDIQASVTENVEKSVFSIFTSKQNWKIVILATVPLLLQQFSGMTVVVTYSQLIFEQTNVSIPSQFCSIIVVGLQVSTAFLTPVLLKSNRISRNSLLMLCLTGLGACNCTLGLYFLFGKDVEWLNWLPLLALVAFVLFYNCGIDPIPWMMLGEIYPNNLSSIGSAVSTSVFLFSIFPILYLFKKVHIAYLFLGPGILSFLGVLYVKFVLGR
ncbi:facilitated trehalose transporter Tret1-like [Coccinella septempunctata]|uniref:facilitated trehalose transporter Tret1-like n=1 Tax=Coccinella septempunctata TaxID=41139 RepID=UPI001D07A62C|nr:facilitated trehalose transporter Tret1-like [Coccinella septempunctata]